jgi:enoyl-CoA hydratase/carnithine racemase
MTTISMLRPHPFHSQNFRHLRLSVVPPSTGSKKNEKNDVWVVSLNRPRKRNAMNAAMWKEIGQAFDAIGSSETWTNCRCVLLMGEGSAFSSGIDISDATFFPPQSADNNIKKDTDVAHVGLTFLPKLVAMQDAITALERCPVPVVAAIHGNCIGAGIDLVCAADIRLCTVDTTFSVREVALGLAADVGTLQRLPKIAANASMVREVCLTARDFSATEAVQMGFVSRGDFCNKQQLVAAAFDICTTIARHSPVAVRGTKRALLYARDHSVQDGLEQIATYNALALQGRDLVKAFMAKAAGQEPSFANIPPHSRL